MNNEWFLKSGKIIFFIGICIMSMAIIINTVNQPTQIYITDKIQIVENNTIVYLILTPDKFYTISQNNYIRLLKGYCEVRIINDYKITQFNHLHSKCNYTEESLIGV